jgi:hypothetical protein
MSSSSCDIPASPEVEKEEKEEVPLPRAKFFLELDVEGPFGANEEAVAWENPEGGRVRIVNHDRADCAIPPEECRNVKKNIRNYFCIPELTAEDVLCYFEKIELSRRIADYYIEGYRPCIRPSTTLPQHVRRLILVCMTIYTMLRNRKDLYQSCKEAFLTMRPPILFLVKVRFYGNSGSSCVDILHDLITYYEFRDCRELFSSCFVAIAREGDVELLEIMLQHSIQPHPVMIREAVKGGKIDILNLLVKGTATVEPLSVNTITASSHSTVISYAVYLDNLDIIKFLIMYGADVNLSFSNLCYGRPLECAIYYGKEEIAKYLLDCCARVDFEPQYAGNLVARARERGMSEEFIGLLLAAGCEEAAADYKLPERSMERNHRQSSLSYYYDEYYDEYDTYLGEENYVEVRNAYQGEVNPGDCTPAEELLHHDYGFEEVEEDEDEEDDYYDIIEDPIEEQDDEYV